MTANRARADGVRWRKTHSFGVLRYGFCPDAETWEAERKRTLARAHCDIGDYPRTAGNIVCWHDEHGDGRVLLTIGEDQDDNPVRLVGTIAHECWHITSAIFEAMAEKHAGEETQAYVLGLIVSEMFEDYSRLRSPAAKTS